VLALRRGREDLVSAEEPEATPTPWRISSPRTGEVLDRGTGGQRRLGGLARRIVCDFAIYGDPGLDAEIEADARLIVEAVNALAEVNTEDV
jgi:hypothetical protein